MELLDYEKKHIDFLKDNACECMLFLKKNDEFPISAPCSVVLVGNGSRNTIKGGTGSGDVKSRFFKSIEDALKEKGFNITSTKWMDEYDLFKKSTLKAYIKDTKKKARQNKIFPAVYSMGYFEEEKDYSINIDYDGDICLYVLSRNSGEGNDRRNIKGDVKLSNKEIEDILYLNKKHKKFMLVLNVGGVIDLSPILEVSNILLLSQLGVVTSDVLVDVILGNKNPSGKLSTTWAKPEDYPYFDEFGDLHDTYYKEGIYVGYRYFNTINKGIIFPFGYGLSYTNFKIDIIDKRYDKTKLFITCNVTNIGSLPGKEVLELYVTKPNDKIDNPYIELVGYKKTKLLKPNENEEITISIDFNDLGTYDEKTSSYLLQSGNYIFRVGNSSINLIDVCKCIIKEDIILKQLKNKCGKPQFNDLKLDRKEENHSNLDEFIIENVFTKEEIIYKKDEYTDPFIEKLSNSDLAKICIGHYDSSVASIVGASCKHVVGGAGETTLNVSSIESSITMADGPAGLRLKQTYGIDKKGVYDIAMDPMMEKMLLFFPRIIRPFLKPSKNRHGEIHHQYTTAIPIGTALAQSFNNDFVRKCGEIVAEEMKIFGVDLWLAPALNIHRNILCGRNFEYYSEDPYLSGMMALSMTKGVEANGLGVTIKHFACNNQETNRTNNNSHISERALREIYLKGFEICIKGSKPKALMTSYNLLNGIHTSESYELINDILRCEWKYDGLVMSDWIKSGRIFCKKSIYPAPYAANNILAGNDLTMPGSKKDYKNILNGLKKDIIKREDLIYSASRIYRAINNKNK